MWSLEVETLLCFLLHGRLMQWLALLPLDHRSIQSHERYGWVTPFASSRDIVEKSKAVIVGGVSTLPFLCPSNSRWGFEVLRLTGVSRTSNIHPSHLQREPLLGRVAQPHTHQDRGLNPSVFYGATASPHTGSACFHPCLLRCFQSCFAEYLMSKW